MNDVLALPEALECRRTYLEAGARVNTPDVLAAEVRWLLKALPTLLPAGAPPDGLLTDVVVQDTRRQLRKWLHSTGPRVRKHEQQTATAWLDSALQSVGETLGQASPCNCVNCPCTQNDDCCGNENDTFGCQCCEYHCSGAACGDDYCRGCHVCKPNCPPEALSAWARDTYATMRATAQAILQREEELIVGKDDHERLANLPEDAELRALWNPPATEVVEEGEVRARRITESSATPATKHVRKFLNGRLSEGSHSRARGLVPSGSIFRLTRQNDGTWTRLQAKVYGSGQTPYRVTLMHPTEIDPGTGQGLTSIKTSCSCPMSQGRDRWCKHSGALLYVLAN